MGITDTFVKANVPAAAGYSTAAAIAGEGELSPCAHAAPVATRTAAIPGARLQQRFVSTDPSTCEKLSAVADLTVVYDCVKSEQ
jgi:hypothetical protein